MRPAQKRIEQFEKRRRQVSPEQFIHDSIVKLEKYSEKHREFWKEYLGALANEREKRIEEITEALWQARRPGFAVGNASRIVGGKFGNNPLCTKGSTLDGGRFNFGGDASSFLGAFNCLYAADSLETAYAEKYFLRPDERAGPGQLDALDLQVKKPGTFVHASLRISLDSVIHLGEAPRLRDFCRVIAAIKPPKHFVQRAKALKIDLTTIENVDQLVKALFEDKYKQWGIWVDHPSPSQWFGHYVRQAGINGILYPSLRNAEGTNIAIFPDTFDSDDAFVEVADDQRIIDASLSRMDRTNYRFFYEDQVAKGQIH